MGSSRRRRKIIKIEVDDENYCSSLSTTIENALQNIEEGKNKELKIRLQLSPKIVSELLEEYIVIGGERGWEYSNIEEKLLSNEIDKENIVLQKIKEYLVDQYLNPEMSFEVPCINSIKVEKPLVITFNLNYENVLGSIEHVRKVSKERS
jgi:predicted RNase H-like HicB family nuclease